MVVEVESRDAKHLETGPALVHGNLEPGGRAVLRIGAQTIRPPGKSRPELPVRADQV